MTSMGDSDWRDDLDRVVVAHARVLPLDIVQHKGSGHAGTAVSLTPALYVLFQEYLSHDPNDPHWAGRDRFVLSCGHASIALYLQLYLSGYGLEMEDLRQTRMLGSLTPGHPEYGHTPGVETTTGPLGQGVGNAVGMALAARRLTALFDPKVAESESPESSLFFNRVWCFASDGDLEEGVTHEASSLAGHLRLGGLVVVWDDNCISIEGETAIAWSEDVVARYLSYGWAVVTIDDPEDVRALRRGYDLAVAETERPVLVRLRTQLGYPMPTLGGTAAAHSGAAGVREVAATKVALGLDPENCFAMPPEALEHARRVTDRGRKAHEAWNERFLQWEDDNPESADVRRRLLAGGLPDSVWPKLDTIARTDRPMATRIANSRVLDSLAPLLPELWGGSADLAESNGTLLGGTTSYLPHGIAQTTWESGPLGRLLHFGVREHAMGAVLNGMALGGLTRPFGATFFVFADYMRPAVRLAALMRLPVLYVWSHDSVAAGEDGPTHQPVEHLWSYRAIPRLAVVRPADVGETVAIWRRALVEHDNPIALCLSRQAVPSLAGLGDTTDATRGAYVLRDPSGTVDVLIIATGSEVHLALEAQGRLADQGVNARVVSAPCLEWFEAEPLSYRDSVLPPATTARVSVEAGSTLGWYRWIGSNGIAVGVDDFGASGAGPEVLAERGVTVAAVTQACLDSITLTKAT